MNSPADSARRVIATDVTANAFRHHHNNHSNPELLLLLRKSNINKSDHKIKMSKRNAVANKQ